MPNSTKILPEPARLGDREPADTQSAFEFADLARDLRVQTARRDITERRRITQRLRQALNSGGFALHYQPQVNLRSGQLRGAEAMLRLRHRRRGLILPSQFMPAAERSEIAHDICSWTLHQACMDAARWPQSLLVAVSVSPRQLGSTRLIKSLIEAFSSSGLSPDRLELELTETMLVETNDDTFFSLRALHGLGVRIAINDFGVGYVSLGALKRLQLTTLKLDRSLIQNLGRDEADAAIIHAAVEAGHALGFSILADGVETEDQCRTLGTLGCDVGQGAYFGATLAVEDLWPRILRG